MASVPFALYGLKVSPGDGPVPAVPEYPASFRITMAAIDPSEELELDDSVTGDSPRPRATLKIIRQIIDSDDEDSEDDESYMRALIGGGSDSEEDSDESDDEESNGGPSDPTKSKKARKEAALKQLLESMKADESDEDMADIANGTDGTKADKKGKGKATSEDEDSESDSDEEGGESEEFVLCTLDPAQLYQQPLDITIAEGDRVYFQVTGTHTIYLTGSYITPDEDQASDGHNRHHEVYDSNSDGEEDEYDLSPDEDELELALLDGDESDDLDNLEDPRITEIDSDDDEAPKLSKKEEKKGKNKRTADALDEPTSLDDIISKSTKSDVTEEPKLSKKQLKKLKKNNGEAAAVKADIVTPVKTDKATTPVKSDKSDKKVQFAKNLEQGPTGSAEKAKAKPATPATPAKAALGPRKVGGVTVDDKKIGSGPVCKKGNKVEMRYIGKLLDGKVFDSNKKGKPFGFKLGTGEVIQGWDIGIAGMQVGGERRLTIPASQAYGSKGQPGIPANSTLQFDVKLLAIR